MDQGKLCHSYYSDFGSHLQRLQSESPCMFIYDQKIIRENCLWLKQNWSQINERDFKLYYSVKANPNPHLLLEISQYVEGFDVSSETELELVQLLNFKNKKISFSGPLKTRKSLEILCAQPDACIHIDSAEELNELLSIDVKAHLTLRCSLGSSTQLKLGFDPESLVQILNCARPRTFSGLHMYMGRESFDPTTCIQQIDNLLELYRAHSNAFTDDFQVYFGPGIPGFAVQAAESLWKGHSPKSYAKPINLEAGRAVVSSAGLYSAPIASVKNPSGARRLAIINGGIQHLGTSLLSPAQGDKGLQYSVFRNGQILTEALEPTTLYGSLCLAHDVLHPNLALPVSLRRGDQIVLKPCGAYGITASPNQFIGQTMANEFLMDYVQDSIRLRDISPNRPLTYHYGFNVNPNTGAIKRQ